MRVNDLFRLSRADQRGQPHRGLLSRLAVPLRAWRQQARQWDELADLERNGQLGPVLTDIGLPYGQLTLFMRAHPRSAGLRAGMMRWLGLDATRVAAAGETREVEWRCLQCATWRECRDWLATSEAARPLPSFCPNMDTFDRLLADQHQSEARGPNKTGAPAAP